MSRQNKKAVFRLGASIRCFNTWRGMQDRCNNPRASNYRYYGGRGIKICARWHTANKNGFQNFFLDMGNPPENFSLDRLDVNKGYDPKNCRWADKKAQIGSRRRYGALETYTTQELAAHIKSMPVKEITTIFTAVIKKQNR